MRYKAWGVCPLDVKALGMDYLHRRLSEMDDVSAGTDLSIFTENKK